MGNAVLTVELELKLSRESGRDFHLDIAFEAKPEITIIFGPSGSGKSTTLGCIAGLTRPDAGRVRFGEETWFDSTSRVERPIHTRGIAYVFQSLALFPHLTALENVLYGIDRALPSAERRQRALAMLERMRVPHLAHSRPRTFSGGEAQRVALARAFAMSPRLVLLDEPFSAMDRELRHEFAADVRGFIDEARIPLLHVTHHRNEARALADRVLLFDAGRIKAAGTVDELLPASDPGEDPVPNLRGLR